MEKERLDSDKKEFKNLMDKPIPGYEGVRWNQGEKGATTGEMSHHEKKWREANGIVDEK